MVTRHSKWSLQWLSVDKGDPHNFVQIEVWIEDYGNFAVAAGMPSRSAILARTSEYAAFTAFAGSATRSVVRGRWPWHRHSAPARW